VPRYFFHLYNDVEARDAEGVEMPNIGAARMVAIQSARFTIAETIKVQGRFVGDHRIDIENAEGQVLDTVYFADAVTIEAPQRAG
jgi:hypothetical protein